MVNEMHVQALREFGLNAKLLYFPATGKVERFESLAPVLLAGEGIQAQTDDIFVVPESWSALHKLLANTSAKKILHCQNSHYIFHGFDNIESITKLKYDNILACSQYVKDFFDKNAFNLEVDIVRPNIDEVFRPSNEVKNLQIAYMPRKRMAESIYIQGLFKSKYPKYRDIPWVVINELTKKECAKILKESVVFASLSFMEGLGLPPLEAMKSGCICVGFTGLAGVEYANDKNGYWVEEGNYDQFAHFLAKALDERNNIEVMNDRIKSYDSTLKMFSTEKFRSDLLKFWTKILSNKINNYKIDQ